MYVSAPPQVVRDLPYDICLGREELQGEVVSIGGQRLDFHRDFLHCAIELVFRRLVVESCRCTILL